MARQLTVITKLKLTDQLVWPTTKWLKHVSNDSRERVIKNYESRVSEKEIVSIFMIGTDTP